MIYTMCSQKKHPTKQNEQNKKKNTKKTQTNPQTNKQRNLLRVEIKQFKKLGRIIFI